MTSFDIQWILRVALCVVSTFITMTAGKNIVADKKATTLVERIQTSSVYADALKLVGHMKLAIHKANNKTVFFAPKVDTAPFEHHKDAESMARFFNSHTAQIPDIWNTDNEQIVYNTYGHPLRLNTYFNPRDAEDVYTVNGVIMGTVIKCSTDGSNLVRLQDGLLPATRFSVAKAASKVQILRAFAQALEFTGLGAQIDKYTLILHVVNGTRYSDGIFEADIVKLDNKDALTVIDGQSALILQDMALIELDLPLHNGVLQAIDGIFTVPDLPDKFRIHN